MKLIVLSVVSCLLMSCTLTKDEDTAHVVTTVSKNVDLNKKADFNKEVKNTIKIVSDKKLSSKMLNVCPIVASRNWNATLVPSLNGEGGNTLTIEGEVDINAPGYELNWHRGPMDRMFPPGLRLIIKASESKEKLDNVTAWQPLQYSIHTPVGRFRLVAIYCGDKMLTKINNIQVSK